MIRYAHNEGHTLINYHPDEKRILTCGSDGDVRIFKDIDDTDPVSIRVGEVATAIACSDERFYVSTDMNSVHAYLINDSGDPDGIVTKFQSRVTDMELSADKTRLLIGSGDFTMKCINLKDNTCKEFTGHTGPVLSVALDPLLDYAASTSGDGSMKVWKISDQTIVKSFNFIAKANSFRNAKSIAKLSWLPTTGKYLAVPVEKEIRMFERTTFNFAFEFGDSSITNVANLVRFSTCSTLVAGAYLGEISVVVWSIATKQLLHKFKHPKGYTICSMAWHADISGIDFCDNNGNMGSVDLQGIQASISNGNDLADASAYMLSDDDMDNENSFSISQMKAETTGDVDIDLQPIEHILEKKKPTVVKPPSKPNRITSEPDDPFDDDQSSLFSDKGSVTQPLVSAPVSTQQLMQSLTAQMQPAFQPGSTPLHLQERFMVYNSVGFVQSYNTEDENSIDVEFHDASTSHGFHINNSTSRFTMASLSTTTLLLASPKTKKANSRLSCMNFASWDSSASKEWQTEMAEDESITAIALSNNWCAVTTNMNLLRVFTLGGAQCQVISLNGPVVCLTAFENSLAIVYHQGIGLPGEQNLSVHLANVNLSRCSLGFIQQQYVPLTPKANLMWIGYTDEGSLCAMDSANCLRLLTGRSTRSAAWFPIANLKLHVKGKSDNYFIVGINETTNQIRCILCKGSRYPPTLPRPIMITKSMQLPYCERDTEKATLEESLWKSVLLSQTFDKMARLGLEVDENEKESNEKARKEVLMKMFALACRTEREYRAAEIANFMPDHTTVQLAIKYVSRLGKVSLANRLNEVARSKQDEEQRRLDGYLSDDDDVAVNECVDRFNNHGPTVSSRDDFVRTTFKRRRTVDDRGRDGQDYEDDVDITLPPLENRGNASSASSVNNPSVTVETPVTKSRNPFKAKAAAQPEMNSTTKDTGIQAFDALTKTSLHSKQTSSEPYAEKPLKTKTSSKQSTLFAKNKKDDSKVEKQKQGTITFVPTLKLPTSKTGFQLWFEESKSELREKNADASEADLIRVGLSAFKVLSAEEKEEWNAKTKGPTDTEPLIKSPGEESESAKEGSKENSQPEAKAGIKRKSFDQDDVDEEEASKKKEKASPITGASKLATFAFQNQDF